MISDFLTNIDNDLEYIKVYDKDDQLISPDNYEDTLITTGSKLKLVINDTEHDNVLVIIRGDVNQDGRVNVKDTTLVTSHIIMKERIEDYRIYAADVVETEGATMENAINVKDKTKISGYVTKKIDSLNEKEGDD